MIIEIHYAILSRLYKINHKTSNAFLRWLGEQEVRFTFFKRYGFAASCRINLLVISYFILTFRRHRNISILFA
jgi:hypothetical protein